ncbi:MAG: hypothetical protein EU533_04880 [Promethearchaeota archaeon]|nr:MAG: hypothetical protein EU533_04880 [Candidatus Lokiarchaeota archaeon]
MRHLEIEACWEYKITENKIDEPAKYHFFLIKKTNSKLEFTTAIPELKPDLILYFTENAVLELIKGKPTIEEYYKRYRNIMKNPQPGIELDSKINKPRLKLLKLGYRSWQKDFKF